MSTGLKDGKISAELTPAFGLDELKVIPQEPQYCDTCGRSMLVGQTNMIGISFVFGNQEMREQFQERYPEITKDRYRNCYVCYMRAAGFKL